MKKISAVMAAISALLFSVFAFAPSAMADPYSATITPGTSEGSATITVTIDEATAEAYPYIVFQYDDTQVSAVEPVALTTIKLFKVTDIFTKNGSNWEKTFKVSTLNCKDATVTVLGAKDANGTGAKELGKQTVSFANTCPAGQGGVNTGANTTAQTGASVLPYAVAVVLMAAAGAAMFAVRKNSVR